MEDIKDLFSIKFHKLGNCKECGEEVSSPREGDAFTGYCFDCKVKKDEEDRKQHIINTVDKWYDNLDDNTEAKISYGVPKRYLGSLLSNFEGDGSTKAKEWAGSNDNLLIQSPKAGNGKTHLAIATMLEQIKATRDKSKELSLLESNKNTNNVFSPREIKYVYPSAKFVNFSDLMLEVKASFDSSDITEQDVIRKYTRYNILVVDDIGAEKSSDYTQAVIYSILNKRYEDMKPTIITTNLSSGDITGSYGSRILSRIASGVVITLEGKDRRLSK